MRRKWKAVCRPSGVALLICFSSVVGFADPLPFPDGSYVTNEHLCSMSQDQRLVRYGDQLGAMVRNLSGDKIDNGYEMYCRIGRVQKFGQTVRFHAVCEMEGQNERVTANYEMVSPTSFRIGSRTFSLCRQVPSTTKVTETKSSPIKLEWKSSVSNATRSNLNHFYNRSYVEIYDRNIDWQNMPFRVATPRLRNEPNLTPEIVVHWQESGFCGSAGCAIEIWSERNGKYESILRVMGGEIEIGETSHMGFRDLWLDDNRWRWNGRSYERR
jgi:hypothetical protein